MACSFNAWNATTCSQALIDKITTVATGASGKVFHIYDQDVLLGISEDLSFPCVGVVYLGMTPIGTQDDSGGSQQLHFDIIFIFGSKEHDKAQLVSGGKKDSAVTALDLIRKSIIGSTSPTNHMWVFGGEGLVGSKEDAIGYFQSWSTMGVFNA